MIWPFLLACRPAGSDGLPPPHSSPGGTGSTASTGGLHSSDQDTAVCVGGCDDGLDCTADACDLERGRCVYTPLTDCPWPASDPSAAISLVPADPDLAVSLSGASWNPSTKDLWLVRNSGPSGVWKLRERAGGGAFEVVEDASGAPAEWFDVGDAESVTLRDPAGAPSRVLIVDEDLSEVVEWDLSDHRSTDVLARWDLSSVAPPVNRLGLEGMAFVPDAVLAEWGFVGADGKPRTSRLGMGGLVLVSHQLGGWVLAFDLDPAGGRWEHVGTFQTARQETSGLELDADTGRLYLWHGGGANDLEVARLSSTPLKEPGLRRFDTEAVFDHPARGNLEGVALAGIDDCGPAGRSLFLVEDEGEERSIARYPDWPLGCR